MSAESSLSKDQKERREHASATRKEMLEIAIRNATVRGYTVYPYIYRAGKNARGKKIFCFAVIKEIKEIKDEAEVSNASPEASKKSSKTEEHSGVKFHVFDKQPEFDYVLFRKEYDYAEIAMQALYHAVEQHLVQGQ